MPSTTTLIDLTLYSWVGVFLLCLCIGFPPLAALYLLFPVWHRRRVRKRAARAQAHRAAQFERWAMRFPHK